MRKVFSRKHNKILMANRLEWYNIVHGRKFNLRYTARVVTPIPEEKIEEFKRLWNEAFTIVDNFKRIDEAVI